LRAAATNLHGDEERPSSVHRGAIRFAESHVPPRRGRPRLEVDPLTRAILVRQKPDVDVNEACGPVFESIARIEPCYSHTFTGVARALAPKRRSASRDLFSLGATNGAIRTVDRAGVRDEGARSRGGSMSARRWLPRTTEQRARQQEQRGHQNTGCLRMVRSDVAACSHRSLPKGQEISCDITSPPRWLPFIGRPPTSPFVPADWKRAMTTKLLA